MEKNILVISFSLRKRSNSELLAGSFIGGAKAAGHHVEKISIRDKRIDFCRGCLACQHTGRCVIGDDGNDIAGKMLAADVLVFATPIYYYEMSGQMKTMLDRSNPLFTADYAFRDIYMLSTAAEDGAEVPERAVSGLQGWINCYEQARLAGTVFGGGVNERGEIRQHPEKLREAYEMGRAV